METALRLNRFAYPLAGIDPAIHVFASDKDVDPRVKPAGGVKGWRFNISGSCSHRTQAVGARWADARSAASAAIPRKATARRREAGGPELRSPRPSPAAGKGQRRFRTSPCL